MGCHFWNYFILTYLYSSVRLISIKTDYNIHGVPLVFFGKSHLDEISVISQAPW